MWEGMDLVRVYLNETEAQVDRARLEAAGIASMLATDNCGGLRPHLDLQAGVRLLVADGDAATARELLGAAPAAGDAPWRCTDCDAPGDPGYDACWNCGQARA